MKKTSFLVTSLVIFLLCGCSSNSVTPEPSVDPLEIPNLSLFVYGENNEIHVNNKEEGETFSYTYEGDNIRIEQNQVIAIRGGTQTVVNVTSNKNRSGTFTVSVRNRPYVSKHQNAEEIEGWFNEVSVNKIDSMTNEFANGMDISSLKQLYDNGQQFYNREGKETSLLYILKDAGLNWIRLRLWNDPKDTWIDENQQTHVYQYGGGNCDIDHVSWIAHEAKAAGLKVLLDFHYSDFWADPGNQIVPKMWKDIDTVEEMVEAIRSFTTESLQTLKDNNALPDAVSIGNETTSGMLMHNPGPVTTDPNHNGAPKYTSEKYDRDNGTQGHYWFNLDNNIKYIEAGANAVKEFDNNILTMIHNANKFAKYTGTISYFNTFKDLNIDIFAVSAYSYYHFKDGLNVLRDGLTHIANAFPNKKICIAETSYGFTYESDVNASNSFTEKGDISPLEGYPCNIQGQASILRDVTEVVSDLSNGFGCFYWEGAWTPTKKCGWAGSMSKASWANQALFSYNGKALGSLSVYSQMLGN